MRSMLAMMQCRHTSIYRPVFDTQKLEFRRQTLAINACELFKGMLKPRSYDSNKRIIVCPKFNKYIRTLGTTKGPFCRGSQACRPVVSLRMCLSASETIVMRQRF